VFAAATVAPRLSGAEGVRLGCAQARIEVDDQVVAAASRRCALPAFRSDEGAVELSVERGAATEEWSPLFGAPGPGGRFLLQGSQLFCDIPDDDVWSAESVLRLAWLVATIRQGGILMHGCAFGWQGQGVAAIGISTAGKSTLGALASAPPAKAILLTDEIVQLFPDGRCFGTPFRSNVENVGQPGPVKLKSLLLLEKGSNEALAPVAAPAALAELLPQMFWFASGEGSLPEQKRRLFSVVDTVGVQRLTFRKDPAVGTFLKQWLLE